MKNSLFTLLFTFSLTCLAQEQVLVPQEEVPMTPADQAAKASELQLRATCDQVKASMIAQTTAERPQAEAEITAYAADKKIKQEQIFKDIYQTTISDTWYEYEVAHANFIFKIEDFHKSKMNELKIIKKARGIQDTQLLRDRSFLGFAALHCANRMRQIYLAEYDEAWKVANRANSEGTDLSPEHQKEVIKMLKKYQRGLRDRQEQVLNVLRTFNPELKSGKK